MRERLKATFVQIEYAGPAGVRAAARGRGRALWRSHPRGQYQAVALKRRRIRTDQDCAPRTMPWVRPSARSRTDPCRWRWRRRTLLNREARSTNQLAAPTRLNGTICGAVPKYAACNSRSSRKVVAGSRRVDDAGGQRGAIERIGLEPDRCGIDRREFHAHAGGIRVAGRHRLDGVRLEALAAADVERQQVPDLEQMVVFCQLLRIETFGGGLLPGLAARDEGLDAVARACRAGSAAAGA